MDKSKAREIYSKLVRIRYFEERVAQLFAAGELPGFVHLYIGEEASAVGVCSNLSDDDYITSTHRGHGHCIAKGGDVSRMMAELMGKATGYNKGKGGSMHLASTELGILGANGIVAAGMPIATGAALTARFQKNGRVAVAFFGDGATNQGTFHEAINFASVFQLPVLFVCENNQYGVGSRITESTNIKDIATRAASYGIPGEVVDGQDVMRVHEAAGRLIERARSGQGPALLECKTWRYRAHFEGEPDAAYKSDKEEREWERRDPIIVARKSFVEEGLLTDHEMDDIEKAVHGEIESAVEFGRSSPDPKPDEALEDLFA